MIQRSEKSLQLNKMMVKMGYPSDFCEEITKNLNTDYTAQRMIGYLYNYGAMPPVEVVDEMLAILSDRNSFIRKKQMEETNASWNELRMSGLFDDET